MNSHCHNCEDTAKHNVALEEDNAALRKVLEAIQEKVKEGLRFIDGHASESYLQQELRKLLNLIEQTLSKGETE